MFAFFTALFVACPQPQEIDICRVPYPEETRDSVELEEPKDEYVEPQAECASWHGGDCYSRTRIDAVRFE